MEIVVAAAKLFHFLLFLGFMSSFSCTFFSKIRFWLRVHHLFLGRILHFHARSSKPERLFAPDVNGVSIADLYLNRKDIGFLLARLLQEESFYFHPPTQKYQRVGKKMRHIFSYILVDRLMLCILNELLGQAALSFISAHVYSYIKGRSHKQAVGQFLQYLRKIQKTQGKPDVFVLRADISNYTDSIPVGSHSHLWQILDKIIDQLPDAINKQYIHKLVMETLRPIITTPEGFAYQKSVGVPTGNALSNLTANIYLLELDEIAIRVPDGFYARFGDDFIFAHPDLEKFVDCETKILEKIAHLGLSVQHTKKQRFYLTRAGKKLLGHDEFTGCNKINFLGYVIYANRQVSFSNDYIKHLLSEVKQRIMNCLSVNPDRDPEDKGRLVCATINTILDVNNPFSEKKLKNKLKQITHRGTLKQIDYAIALLVAENLTGIKGVRAFRKIPYQSGAGCYYGNIFIRFNLGMVI